MNDFKGLTSNEVVDSRNKYGSNKLSEFKKSSLFSLIIESLNDPIIKILLVALGIKILFFFLPSILVKKMSVVYRSSPPIKKPMKVVDQGVKFNMVLDSIAGPKREK